jgi:hypothetical protein
MVTIFLPFADKPFSMSLEAGNLGASQVKYLQSTSYHISILTTNNSLVIMNTTNLHEFQKPDKINIKFYVNFSQLTFFHLYVQCLTKSHQTECRIHPCWHQHWKNHRFNIIQRHITSINTKNKPTLYLILTSWHPLGHCNSIYTGGMLLQTAVTQ